MSDSSVLLFLLFWFLVGGAGFVYELNKHFRRGQR
jgi:hypothetical protein